MVVARFRTLLRWPAVVLVGLLMLSGCATTGADEQTRRGAEKGFVGVDGNLTQIAPSQRKPVGAISGPALGGGQTLSAADYAGKVIVVNVWGSWCQPCRAEAPDLQAASEETTDSAQFIGLNTRDSDPAQAEAFVRTAQITYPSIFDPDGQLLLSFARDLPPSGIPSTMIIDKQGRLAVRIIGPITKVTLVNLVDDVADGK